VAPLRAHGRRQGGDQGRSRNRDRSPLTRLRSFSIHTADTTRLKIGIDIVDGSETIVEDIAIGTQDSGTEERTSLRSPAPDRSASGSRAVRNVPQRPFGRRNPLYIANNPNSRRSISIITSSTAFTSSPRRQPVGVCRNGTNLTNVAFENGGFVLGGAGFYWPDTTSVGNSNDLSFRNIRAEQFSDDGYAIYITKASPLRGLRIEDFLTGSGTQSKGVYLRGVGQAVFDTYNYHGTLECLNSDSQFDWRNSLCTTYSTVNLNSLAEIWSESLPDSNGPMPIWGRWDTAHTNHVAGLTRRFMGVYQLAQTGSITNGSTVQIPSRFGSIVLGRISIVFKGSTKNGSFTVAVTSAGAYLESTTDATITGIGNLANKITVHWSSPSAIPCNNLGNGDVQLFVFLELNLCRRARSGKTRAVTGTSTDTHGLSRDQLLESTISFA
jgi:hypothetical protein